MKKLSNYMVVFFFGLLLAACGKDDEPTNTISELPVVPAPTISGFQPTSGPPGRTVTITGTNLEPPAGDDPSVKFNNTPAKVISFSETEIVTSVPAGIPVGASTGQIFVDVGTQGAVSAGEFNVTIPALEFAPETGVPGDVITVTMANFDFDTADAENNSILFNGVPGVIESVTSNQVEVTVPASVSGPLTINVGEISVPSADSFAFLPPTITATDPSISGTVGSTVLILGENFSTDPTFNSVTFPNQIAETTIVNSSEGELEVVIPYGATTGDINITVGANSVSVPFTVEPWRKMQDFPGSERTYAVAETVGNTIFVGLGQELSTDFGLSDFWEFNPLEDEWIQVEDFPGIARAGAFSFVINGEIYVGGGFNPGDPEILRDVYKFSPGAGWSEVASIGYTIEPEVEEEEPIDVELDYIIAGASGYTIDGIGFVYGGINPNTQSTHDQLWSYDPSTDSWSAPSIPGITGRANAIAFEYGNTAYLGLGISEGAGFQKDFRTIDGEGSVSTDIGYPGEGSFSSTGVVIGDRAYVGLGENGVGFNTDMWAFDFGTQEWIQKMDYPGDAPDGQFSSTANGMLYIGLGSADNGNTFLKDIWEYNPSNDPDPMEE